MTFAETQQSTISGFIPYSSGDKRILIFKLDGNVTGGCNTTGRFAIDDTSPRYEATLSAVLASYHAQTKVRVNYFPTCNAWGNSADINFICVGDINC
jgi:hypothetical protein